MTKKKSQKISAKPLPFRTNHFSTLKGVVAAKAVPLPSENTDKTVALLPPEDDDAEIFRSAMNGVKLIDNFSQESRENAGPPRKRSGKSEKIATTMQSSQDPDASELFFQEIDRLKLEVKFTENLSNEDELKPLSGNRIKLLKRGVISVKYQLDLHGLTKEEALTELPRFLRTARMKSQIAVLVITGKGYNSLDEPVLQQAVVAWLRDAGREYVVEFSPAPRSMGGSGALVIFLRPLTKTSAVHL